MSSTETGSVLALGGILWLCQTPQQFCRLENPTRASVHTAVRSKGKFHYLEVNPFNDIYCF